MVGCHRCGGRSREGARYCGSCGTLLGSARSGVRKTVTVLFADAPVLGAHHDLELDVRAATAFYESLREVLERYGGTVERHAGDAVMAVFGVPVARDDDARRAAAAALELREVASLVPGTGPLSVGVNTGEVLTGELGTDEELVVGDPVVVAARLQQVAAPGEVLLGPATLRLLRHEAVLGETREITLRGRQGGLPVVPLLALAPPPPPPERGPFVGRDTEVRMVRAALERTVRTGIVQLVTVLGEAGTGKSRLVDEVLRTQPGIRVVRGVCRAYGGGTRWPTMTEVRYDGTEPEVGIAELLARDTRQLGGVRHVLNSFFGDGDNPMSPEDLAWAIATVLREASTLAPVVVVLEDLHAAAPELLELVPAIVERLDPVPVLGVVTARPELLEQRPHWGRGLPHVVGLTLRPLPEEQSTRLAEHLLQGDTGGVPSLVAAAGGNPLFLEQLAQARREGSTSDTAATPSVTAVLAARLDRLPLGARQVLERAAVIGPSGPVADLLPLCEGVDVESELELLASRDLLEVEQGRWSFGSELVRDAAVGGLSRDERAELHQVRGLVLGARGQAAPAGFHLEEASRLLRTSDPERSAVLAEQAASRLAAAGLRALSGDLVAACDLLERAVALLPEDSPRRLNLLTELSRGLQLTGDLTRARDVLEEAIRRCDARGLREVGAHSRLALVDLERSTEPERAYAELPGLLAEVLPALESARDDRGLSLAYQLEAAALQYRVHWAAMEAPLARSLHHAGRAGDRRLVELAQSLQVGSLFHGPMPLDQARPRLELLLAQPSGSPWHQASVAARLGGILALQGDPDAGRQQVAQVRQVFHDLGRELSALATTFMSGPLEMLAGDPLTAAKQLSEACDGLLAMGDRAFTSTLASLMAEAWWRCGEHESAAAAVSLSRRLAGLGDVMSQVRWRSVHAKLHAVRRNHREAEALCAQAVQLVIGTDELTSQGDVLADAAEVQLMLGNRSAADVLLRDAVERYERKGAPQAVAILRARLT